MTPTTFYNQVSADNCPIPTCLDGKHRYADFRDAAYLDVYWTKVTT